MKSSDKELIEERINSSVEKSKVINYCLGNYSGMSPGFLTTLVVFFVLGSYFYDLLRAAILVGSIFIISIIFFYLRSKQYIVVFLNDNLLLIRIKGANFNIIDTYFHKYHEIKGMSVGEKGIKILLENNIEFFVQPSANDSSFLLKDFDVNQFVLDKQQEENESKEKSRIFNQVMTKEEQVMTKEEIEEKKTQVFEERLKKKTQMISDSLLAEKDKGLITNDDYLKKRNEIIETCKSELTELDSHISYDVYLKLAETKQATVERLLENIKKDELIVYQFHKIKLISEEMWESIVSEGNSGNYEIVFK
jgi:hypothetical protein